MVKFIESELILLKKEIDEMWTLVYNQLDRAGEAVLTLDKELAQQVMVRERRVNAFELKIDSDVEDIIALYNPVAIDLRFVLAMLKINTNLERLGDFAEGIARFVLRCKEPVLDAELLNRLRLAVGGCIECRCRRNYPQNRRITDENRCTGCDGRKEAGIQLSDFGKDCRSFQKIGS